MCYHCLVKEKYNYIKVKNQKVDSDSKVGPNVTCLISWPWGSYIHNGVIMHLVGF